jgi:hypothetical protein
MGASVKNVFKSVLAAFLIANSAFAVETGPANSVMRVPSGGGRPKFGAVDLSSSVAVTNQLPVSKGGTGAATLTANGVLQGNGTSAVTSIAPSTAGNMLASDGTNWVSKSVDGLQLVRNVGLGFSVASSALTISLKQSDGSTNCSSSAPCMISFRAGSVTSGAYTTRSVTGALSTVISSGSTAGHANATDQWLYIYALDNLGTVELAWSSVIWDEGSVQSTTAEGGAGAADSIRVLYSTTARSNVPIRLLARVKSNQTTAGTWAAVPTEVSPIPFERPKVYVSYGHSSTYTVSTSDQVVWYDTKFWDNYNLVTGSGSSWIITIPKNGIYTFAWQYLTGTSVGSSAQQSLDTHLNVNGSNVRGCKTSQMPGATSSIPQVVHCTVTWYLSAGDTISTSVSVNTGSFNAGGGSTLTTWISMIEEGRL